MTYRSLITVFGCLLALCLVGGAPALAQNQEDAAGGQAEEVAATEEQTAETPEEAQRKKFAGEIVVTSTRRELKVREVPASVSRDRGLRARVDGRHHHGRLRPADCRRQLHRRGTPARLVTMRGIATSTYSNINAGAGGDLYQRDPGDRLLRVHLQLRRHALRHGAGGVPQGPAGHALRRGLAGRLDSLSAQPAELDRNAGRAPSDRSRRPRPAAPTTWHRACSMWCWPRASSRCAAWWPTRTTAAGSITSTLGDDYNSYTQTNAPADGQLDSVRQGPPRRHLHVPGFGPRRVLR